MAEGPGPCRAMRSRFAARAVRRHMSSRPVAWWSCAWVISQVRALVLPICNARWRCSWKRSRRDSHRFLAVPGTTASRILLADADAFFVAVARLVDPEAANAKLLIVGGTRGRGVVTSASYEARQFGV